MVCTFCLNVYSGTCILKWSFLKKFQVWNILVGGSILLVLRQGPSFGFQFTATRRTKLITCSNLFHFCPIISRFNHQIHSDDVQQNYGIYFSNFLFGLRMPKNVPKTQFLAFHQNEPAQKSAQLVWGYGLLLLGM